MFIEREIFYRIAIGEAACLPSGGTATLYDKKRDSGGVASAGIEQRAQNFPLRGTHLDFSNGARQIRRAGRRRRIIVRAEAVSPAAGAAAISSITRRTISVRS